MITAIPIRTRYQHAEQPVSVATPSCCCCCCCCLATVVGVLTFTATEVSTRRSLKNGHWAAIVVGIIAVPIGITLAVLASIGVSAQLEDGRPAIFAFVVTYVLIAGSLYLLAYRLAGEQSHVPALMTFFLLSVFSGIAAVVELWLVLLIGGLVWLVAIPTAIWLMIKLGKHVNTGPPPVFPRYLTSTSPAPYGASPSAPQPPAPSQPIPRWQQQPTNLRPSTSHARSDVSSTDSPGSQDRLPRDDFPTPSHRGPAHIPPPPQDLKPRPSDERPSDEQPSDEQPSDAGRSPGSDPSDDDGNGDHQQ